MTVSLFGILVVGVNISLTTGVSMRGRRSSSPCSICLSSISWALSATSWACRLRRGVGVGGLSQQSGGLMLWASMS